MLSTDHLERADRRPARIDTPLGIVGFSVTLGADPLPAAPDTVWRLPNDARLHRWRHRTATVDLLIGSIEIPAWDGGAPVPMWAGIWQVSANAAVPGLVVAAEVTDLPADAHGGPDTGECLAAVSIENEHFSVSIGGADSELLAMQAADGRLLPADWADLLPADGNDELGEYGVRYRDPAGIAWHLPGLATREVARLCVATAWCPRDDDRPAAWFAVDIPLDTAYLHLTADR
ncbi:hypothetical protein [Nocardia seriolae]|uniref:Uncharacterized protein n=1 Tax=Nocardia seriolae TaxID=37332 RepID=A0A0B8NM27_9NOCA|nr:hypothetical protein [Nocardia seriolae]MTJ66047.1 hypothetical protein [Nocardia seriolae]MTJ76013.1 hypothetical protein [Nocardia seriolae]MTJ86033.1 hypothetical protein [Nocardia seriolae]MTK30028.1 hypothetical protein [Nocardia seriolae]MTK44045.1 hypothetical protein [Nocardia seriolae]